MAIDTLDSGPFDQYDGNSAPFSGMDSALYERHLFFDKVSDVSETTTRDHFEAFARSVRDILRSVGC